jgi:hypothetical protein
MHVCMYECVYDVKSALRSAEEKIKVGMYVCMYECMYECVDNVKRALRSAEEKIKVCKI